MQFEIAVSAIQGGRGYQEDSWRLSALNGQDATSHAAGNGVQLSGGALVVVADGMGGEGGGEEASRVVAEAFTAAYFADGGGAQPAEDQLRVSLAASNAALVSAKKRGSTMNERSGTTLIAGCIKDDLLSFVSVGDSSIWRFRDDEAHRVNIAHERAVDLDVAAANMDTEEAWGYAQADLQRHMISAAVMGTPQQAHEVQVATRRILPNDVLVFATDGIETLSPMHLQRVVPLLLKKYGNAASLAGALTRMVERLGRRDQDNTTIMVIRAIGDERTQLGPFPAATQQTSVGYALPEARPAAAADGSGLFRRQNLILAAVAVFGFTLAGGALYGFTKWRTPVTPVVQKESPPPPVVPAPPEQTALPPESGRAVTIGGGNKSAPPPKKADTPVEAPNGDNGAAKTTEKPNNGEEFFPTEPNAKSSESDPPKPPATLVDPAPAQPARPNQPAGAGGGGTGRGKEKEKAGNSGGPASNRPVPKPPVREPATPQSQ